MTLSHFSLPEFVGYQRRDLPRDLDLSVEKHLQENCTSCWATHDFAKHLTEVIRRDQLATPPSAVLARARNLFQVVPPPTGQPGNILSSTARLIFDSFLQPAAVGIRGGMRMDRHLVFNDRELVLDVHIEPEEEAEQQSITGQVQSSSRSDAQLVGLPVILTEGPRILMSTHTSGHGEFVFSAAPRREVALCVICEDRLVRIPHIPPAGYLAGAQ